MTVEGFLSVEEQRALVYEYLLLPHGGKGRFLVERGVSSGRLRRWRSQVFADTLEHGLVPRAGGSVNVDEAGAKRLLKENQALRDQLAASEEELAIQRRTVDALGKAIELLHSGGEVKNSSMEAADPRTDSSEQ